MRVRDINRSNPTLGVIGGNQSVNSKFEWITGYSEDEILGQNCRILQGPDTDPNRVDDVRNAIVDQEPLTVELTNYRKDGSSFLNPLTLAPAHNEAGDLTNFVGFQECVDELE